MVKRVSVVASFPTFDEIAQHYRESVDSVHLLLFEFESKVCCSDSNFLTNEEVEAERDRRLNETDASSSNDAIGIDRCIRFVRTFIVATNARRRMNCQKHIERCTKRSRKRISLEDDLLELWKKHSTVLGVARWVISEPHSKYRHWACARQILGAQTWATIRFLGNFMT